MENEMLDSIIGIMGDEKYSPWAILFVGIISSAIGYLVREFLENSKRKKEEKLYVYEKFHEYLMSYINLYEEYQQNNMLRKRNTMEDRIEIISHNMQHLLTKCELSLPAELLQKLKDLSYLYDKFAHRISYQGDLKEFDNNLKDLREKTLEIKSVLEEKINKKTSIETIKSFLSLLTHRTSLFH